MKGRAIPYSTDELAWIEERREWPRDVLRDTFVMLFERPNVTLGCLNALCKRKGWMTGRTGCFTKGAAPHNKGKPHPTRGRAATTQFKKGERRGVAVKLYKPIGTERLCKDGYLERKIHDGLPLQSRWRAVHLIEWEAVNGLMPNGMCLKALDGDRSNTEPSNWVLVPRALLPALNGGRHKRRPSYDGAAPEMKPALLTLAKVEHRARVLRGTNPKPIQPSLLGAAE